MVLPELGSNARRDTEARLDEAAGLAEAIGVVVERKIPFRIRGPKAATLFGLGKEESLLLQEVPIVARCLQVPPTASTSWCRSTARPGRS